MRRIPGPSTILRLLERELTAEPGRVVLRCRGALGVALLHASTSPGAILVTLAQPSLALRRTEVAAVMTAPSLIALSRSGKLRSSGLVVFSIDQPLTADTAGGVWAATLGRKLIVVDSGAVGDLYEFGSLPVVSAA